MAVFVDGDRGVLLSPFKDSESFFLWWEVGGRDIFLSSDFQMRKIWQMIAISFSYFSWKGAWTKCQWLWLGVMIYIHTHKSQVLRRLAKKEQRSRAEAWATQKTEAGGLHDQPEQHSKAVSKWKRGWETGRRVLAWNTPGCRSKTEYGKNIKKGSERLWGGRKGELLKLGRSNKETTVILEQHKGEQEQDFSEHPALNLNCQRET